MKKPLGPILLAALLALPVLLPARVHNPSHPFRHAHGLAKTSAASARAAAAAQAATRESLIGFWVETFADSSDPSYQSFDTLEIFFGGDGAWELRSATREVDAEFPEDSVTARNQSLGTWSVTDTEIVLATEKCTDYYDGGREDCSDGEIDTIPLSQWMIGTDGSGRTLTMDADYPDDFLVYAGPEAGYSIKAPLSAGITAGQRGERRGARQPSLSPRLDGSEVTSKLPMLDLRGRRLDAGHPGLGLFILP
jgi:hypothetical protein